MQRALTSKTFHRSLHLHLTVIASFPASRRVGEKQPNENEPTRGMSHLSFQSGLLLIALLLSFSTATISSQFDRLAVDDTNFKYLIVPIDELGLVNRLRIMSSFYSFAEFIQCEVVFLWKQSIDCPSGFDQLFSFTLNNVKVINFNDDGSDAIRAMVYKKVHEANLSISEVYPRTFHIDTDEFAGSVTIVWSRGSHAPKTLSCDEYLRLKHQFYLHLIPSETVLSVVNAFRASVDWSQQVGEIVGVHVRAYDAQHDWPMVTPPADWTGYTSDVASAALRFDQASPLDGFAALMTELRSARHPVRFFLASNSALAKARLVSHFGSDVVLTLPSDGQEQLLRASTAGMVTAAAEFWLLGTLSTDLIIHSTGSSFAREAASVRGIKVVDVSVDTRGEFLHFFSQHPALPLCAMPEFLRSPPATAVELSVTGAASEKQFWDQKVCYREAGDREMCTIQHAVCRCNMLPLSTEHCSADSECLPDRSAAIEQLQSAVHCHVSPAQYQILSEAERAAHCRPVLAESNGYSL